MTMVAMVVMLFLKYDGAKRWVSDPLFIAKGHMFFSPLVRRSCELNRFRVFNQPHSLPLHDENATCLNRPEVDEGVPHGPACSEV